MRKRKPGDCTCHCHKTGMTGALGPCGWCIDLHRPRPPQAEHFGGPAAVCDAVVVKGKYLAAKCGYPSPCPKHSDGSEDA